MDTIPTPRTDNEADDAHNLCLYYDCQGPKDNIPKPIVVPADFARQLERELAEVQELLCQTSAEREHNGRMANECRMQRDRLAEALRPFIDGWSDKSCDAIVTEQQFRDAKQALAAVKGTQP